MSDQRDLHDAFAEYERRADAVTASRAGEPERVVRGHRSPVVFVAASVAVVLVLAGLIVALARDTGAGPQHLAAVGGASPSNSPAAPSPTQQPTASTAPQPSPSGRPTSTARSSATPPPSTAGSTASAPGSRVPQNAQQMQRAFRRVLGDTAKFSVDQECGKYLLGVLTASKSGAKGGFDIQAAAGHPGDKALCEDPGRGSHCTLSSPAAGGSLAVERERYQGSPGELYMVNYVFPDGATYLMHLSTRSDPKGGGRSFGTTPPLTLRQLTEIIESPSWNAS